MHAKRQVVQRCPNCSAKYDVGIYVSGQKVRCRRCGIKFAVVRTDTQAPQPAPGSPGAAAPLGTPDGTNAIKVNGPLEALGAAPAPTRGSPEQAQAAALEAAVEAV